MTFHNTETSNVLSKCDFRLEKHEVAAKTSVQNPVCNQKRTALGRNEDKTSSSSKLSTNWFKPSMSGSTAPGQGMELLAAFCILYV